MMKRLLALALLLMLLCPLALGEGERVIDPKKPMIALTFDDGPTENTQAIIDVLDKYGAKATFFVVGNRITNFEAALPAILKSGHEIGNHSWNHPRLPDLTMNQINRNIQRCNERVSEATGGYTPSFLRPPYGATNKTMYFEAKDYKLITVIWSLDTLDWDVRNADKIYKTVMENVRDGDIVLFHDTVPQNIEVLERILPELAAKGYQFVTVGEMFSFAKEAPKYMAKYSNLYPEKRNMKK
ncbi:MAG: polysaccharide deacetylase family protein [Clostridia bacterium]|nr:polysaccharide deacetylase family protein [Clostridia bacterium]